MASLRLPRESHYEAIPLEQVGYTENSDDIVDASRRLSDSNVSTRQLLHPDSQNKIAAEEDPLDLVPPLARIGPDWWEKQMLADRSLRGMAALTALFAIGLLVIIFVYLQPFRDRWNVLSTSVGREGLSCGAVKRTNMALLFLINIAATMILGMSNTYQQLVTALTTKDIRHALEKFGDSKVGTNSPFTINHKRRGKFLAWSCWILLILTSMPVHLLVNSLIGPSQVVDTDIIAVESVFNSSYSYFSDPGYYRSLEVPSSVCWAAFRTNRIPINSMYRGSLSENPLVPRSSGSSCAEQLTSADSTVRKQYSRLRVTYNATCAQYSGTEDYSSFKTISNEPEYSQYSQYSQSSFQIGNCSMVGIKFDAEGPIEARCRLNIRMLAVFILAACLIIKATYMIVANVRARGTVKTSCLTFGDVIVAAATDPDLRVWNECMVNATYHYRFQVSHTCHKHCTSEELSETGNELGHCQKCKRYNKINKSANLEQPVTATKMKRSLLSLLGGSTLPQLIFLSMCSAGLISGAGILITYVISDMSEVERCCRTGSGLATSQTGICHQGKLKQMNSVIGGWDSNLLVTLGSDSLGNEVSAMLIANAAQAFYSFLYLLLIYNISLISQEYTWGKLERERTRLRCTINRGHSFEESYLMQLPKKILFPLMGYSILIHWLLGECLQMKEFIWRSESLQQERSYFAITYSIYAIWMATVLILAMTVALWWAYSFVRQGFIPQMYGSIRVCCAAATELNGFSENGILWGDLGEGNRFRHAGLSSGEVGKIHPHALYAGRGDKLGSSSDACKIKED